MHERFIGLNLGIFFSSPTRSIIVLSSRFNSSINNCLPVLCGFKYRKDMCLFLVPIGLGDISAPHKPHKSSVMEQIMLPHTFSTVMAIIHKLDLWLCFARHSVLLYNFLTMSSDTGSACYTKTTLSSATLSHLNPNISCDISLLCSWMLIFTSKFYKSGFYPFLQLTSLCITAVITTSLHSCHCLGKAFVLW